jgi:2-alkyl-3-oxoalkanoate reductase
MKIALTGAGDFVGARLIESFHLGSGPSVAAIARHPAELTTAARFSIETRVADFLNADSLARSFSGCSAVVHVARTAPSDMKRAATMLCRAAAQAGIRRIVFLSSADVHGLAPAPGTTEKSPFPAHSASEPRHALALAERQFLTECKQLGIAGYALRAGYVFGPRSDTIAELATLLETERAWLFQQGEGICNSLYVDNLVAAIRVALKAKAGAGAAYLIGDAETITWREFYHAAAHELHTSVSGIRNLDKTPSEPAETEFAAVETDEMRPGFTPTLRPSTKMTPAVGEDLIARQQCTWKLPTARAAAELGYEASVSFSEGMRRSIAWWRFAHGEFFAAA